MARNTALKEVDQAVLTIRLPAGMRNRIDDRLAVRPVKVSRNTWVLEAVVEKLAREEQKGRANGSR